MKKIRGDEQIGVIIHIYMEILQGNSLCSYLYLKQTKMLFFFFFFYKIGEEEGGNVLWGVGRDCYQWEGDVNGNGIGR
jgi:hypothetical protein